MMAISEGSPPKGDINMSRVRFMDICMAILYSDDERTVLEAYDEFFTTYRWNILCETKSVEVSLLEDVVLKILREEDNWDYAAHGVPFLSFDRLLGMIKEQSRCIYKRETDKITDKKIACNLKHYLWLYVSEVKGQLHSDKIRTLLKYTIKGDIKE